MTRAIACLLLLASAAHARPNPLRRAVDACVRVESNTGFGSGFVVDNLSAGSTVLTVAHLFDRGKLDPDVVVVSTGEDGVEHGLRGVFVQADWDHDLALVFVPDLRVRGIKPAKGSPEPLSELFAVGYARTVPRVISKVLYAGADAEDADWKITGGFVVPGTSGGPVLNSRDEVVCVIRSFYAYTTEVKSGGKIVGKFDAPLGEIGFCVPLKFVKEFLR